MTDPAPSYDDLAAEVIRLKSTQPVGQLATLFVVSTVVLAVLTVAAVVGITMARPDKDNTSVIATIVGVVTPILVGLLAAAIQQVHLAVNSRLSQLLELTAAESKARGVASERDRGDAKAVDLLATHRNDSQVHEPVPVTIVSPSPLPVTVKPVEPSGPKA